MNTEYLCQDEIEAHESAMQQLVEEVKRDAVNGMKNMAVGEFSNDKKHSRQEYAKKLAAVQRDFERLPLLRQVYIEAPNDVFELILSKLSQRVHGRRSLNALRMVNKRFKHLVDSCTTLLFNQQSHDGPDRLPISIIQRCKRIEEITCWSHNLTSLEGCPTGLKKLYIGSASHLTDLSPLSSCSMMDSLRIYYSNITDISVVSSMPLLEVLSFRYEPGTPSVKDLSPLTACSRLKRLDLNGNEALDDLSTLSSCTALEHLSISHCPLINSLAPLSPLANLNELCCWGIDPQTSLLPLASCTGLTTLFCDDSAMDLEELSRRRPQLRICN